jgi:tetratricopeptide (TPR) repeat protein
MLELDGNDPLLARIAGLLQQASGSQDEGRFGDVERLVIEAKRLAAGNLQASAEVDLFWAISLVEQDMSDRALPVLASMLIEYSDWLRAIEGKDVYEHVQLYRAFALMHLQRNEEARPLLEEASRFQVEDAVRNSVHYYLGTCYHELSLDSLAQTQFESTEVHGLAEDQQAGFHYRCGYTLYKLKEFQRAKREFILCLQSATSGPELSLRYSMLAATSRKLGEHSEAAAFAAQAKSLKG